MFDRRHTPCIPRNKKFFQHRSWANEQKLEHRVERLLNNVCEICGKVGYVEGHHIRKLKDLKKSKEKPKWAQIMIAMNRKTLFVCKRCHADIHSGRYDGAKLTQFH